MINCTEIRPGQCFIWENELYQCIDNQLNKTAMAKMKVKVKVKQPRTGVVKELSMISGDKVEETFIDRKQMNYLYDAGDDYVFMDNDTYEQVEIEKKRLAWESDFLISDMSVMIMIYEGEILGIILPDKVALKVTQSAPAVRGDTATAALKDATLETGLTIKVPLFINEGEKVLVSTNDGKYSGRA